MSQKANVVKWIVKTLAVGAATQVVNDMVEHDAFPGQPYGYWGLFMGRGFVSTMVQDATAKYVDEHVDKMFAQHEKRSKTAAKN